LKRVKITVLNNDFLIRTDADEEYVKEIAHYLEDKIKEASPQPGSMVVPRPFLLATLRITDDYFRLKREFEEFKNRAEERSRNLVELLDVALKQNTTFDSESEKEREESRKEQQEELFK
jgi:cell division protein ZapA